MSGLSQGLRAALTNPNAGTVPQVRTRQRSATLPHAIPIDSTSPMADEARRKPPRTPAQAPSLPPAMASSQPPNLLMAPTPLTEIIERGQETPPMVARSMTEHGGSHMPSSCPVNALNAMAQSLRDTRGSYLPPLPENDISDQMQALSLGSDGEARPGSLTAFSVMGLRARMQEVTPQKNPTPPSSSTPSALSPEQLNRTSGASSTRLHDDEDDDYMFQAPRQYDDDGVFSMDM